MTKKNFHIKKSLIGKYWKRILFVFFILFLWQIWEDRWFSLFNKYILLWLDIQVNNFTHILFFSCLFLTLYPLCKFYKNKYRVPGHFFLGCILFFLIYGYYRYTYSSSYEYIPESWPLGYIDYVVFFLFVYFVVLLTIRLFLFNRKIEDSPETNIIKREKAIGTTNGVNIVDEDTLGFTKDAKRFVNEVISNIDPDDSYSIGLLDDWGTGKTSYANLIKNELCKKKYIIVEFNPSLTKRNNLIQEDFFQVFYAQLKKYNFAFSKLFSNYMKVIDVISDRPFYQKIKPVFFPKESEREKLNRAIKSLPKRVIVFVDDLDRLDRGGIKEVFKLIYYNASFSNVIFISMYSKSVLKRKLGEGKDTPFSDKYFDEELFLPVRTYEEIFDGVFARLKERYSKKTYWSSGIFGEVEHEGTIFDRIYDTHKNIIKDVLPTYRDIKRFLNIFERNYNLVAGELNTENYFLLYLLYYKCQEVYTDIKNQKWIEPFGNRLYINNKDLFNRESDSKVEYRIMKSLFKRKEDMHSNSDEEVASINAKEEYRTIDKTKYFEAYFRDQRKPYLKKKDIESLFEERENYLGEIDTFLGKKELGDIIEYAIDADSLDKEDKSIIERYILIVLYLYAKTNNQSMVFLIESICKKHQALEAKIADLNIKDYIKSILIGRDGYIYADWIYTWLFRNNQNPFFFSFPELQEIAMAQFKQYQSLFFMGFTEWNMKLLYNCVKDIDAQTHLVTLEPEACEMTRRKIEVYPLYYIENFVRLAGWSSNSQHNAITGEPFYLQLFGSNETFEKFIINERLNTVNRIKRVRNFWKLYKAHGYKPLSYANQGNVQEKIDNDLEEEVEKIDSC